MTTAIPEISPETQSVKARFTSGPWDIEDFRDDHYLIQHEQPHRGAISKTIARVTARRTWEAEAEANAFLISAAPDLYSVVNWLIRHDADAGPQMKRSTEWLCLMQAAYRARAKALTARAPPNG